MADVAILILITRKLYDHKITDILFRCTNNLDDYNGTSKGGFVQGRDQHPAHFKAYCRVLWYSTLSPDIIHRPKQYRLR